MKLEDTSVGDELVVAGSGAKVRVTAVGEEYVLARGVHPGPELVELRYHPTVLSPAPIAHPIAPGDQVVWDGSVYTVIATGKELALLECAGREFVAPIKSLRHWPTPSPYVAKTGPEPGDDVLVREKGSCTYNRRVFARWAPDGACITFSDGRTEFTSYGRTETWEGWKLPTGETE